MSATALRPRAAPRPTRLDAFNTMLLTEQRITHVLGHLESFIASIRLRATLYAVCYALVAFVLLAAAAWRWLPLAQGQPLLLVVLGALLLVLPLGVLLHYLLLRRPMADLDALLRQRKLPQTRLDVPACLLFDNAPPDTVVPVVVALVSVVGDTVIVDRGIHPERIDVSLPLGTFLDAVLDYHFPRGRPESP